MTSLIIGIALGGLITGFMIGASSSPVVGAVIPALLSGIVSALAVIFGDRPAQAQHNQKLPQVLGFILIGFFAPYGLGLGAGIAARTYEWLVPKPAVPGNLAKLTKHAQDLPEALLRIDIFRALQKQGFDDALANQVLGLKLPEDYGLDAIRRILADLSPDVRIAEKGGDDTGTHQILPTKPLPAGALDDARRSRILKLLPDPTSDQAMAVLKAYDNREVSPDRAREEYFNLTHTLTGKDLTNLSLAVQEIVNQQQSPLPQ
jgi:hypothetical protein